MKNLIIVVMLLMVSINVHVYASDFRNADWDMTPEQVKATENKEVAGAQEVNGQYVMIYQIKPSM